MELQAEVKHRLGKRDFQFSLSPKCVRLGIQGPSGSGKTTLLRILAGLEFKANGVVKFEGTTWLDSQGKTFVPPWQRGVGWVPQDALCFPHLSVAGNLSLSGRSSHEEISEMAERLGIHPLLNRRVRNLSGGERHRVSLGRALLAKPKLLLLDEPFSSLHKPLRKNLMEFVKEFSVTHSVPVILVSHDDELISEEVVELK